MFFDSVFAINVLKIFELISEWPKALELVKPKNSQHKPTVLIPITLGEQVGAMTQAPQFEAKVRRTELGRIDAYVVPTGGLIQLDRAAVERVLFTH